MKITVFLTGASGTMGWAAFKELYARTQMYNIVVLLRDSKKNRAKFAAYLKDPHVRIVWGDLTEYDDVLDAVTGADYILHVGGMVSPAADYFPKKTLFTNITAMKTLWRLSRRSPTPTV